MPSSHAGLFKTLNGVLKRHGDGVPRMVIDLDLLDANILALKDLQDPACVRLVVKSLPCADLLEYIGERLWANARQQRLMVFHLPFLLQLNRQFPAADILMGKPMPVQAMSRYYTEAVPAGFDPDRQLQWLVDTPARLQQVIDLAQKLDRRPGINLELDVGMHRGGISNVTELKRFLQTIRKNTQHVRLSGFMGYDAHAAKAPWPKSRQGACESSIDQYARMVASARESFADLEEQPWCLNGAGSPTLSMHDESTVLNDFSVGSALLKPSEFDLPSLSGFQSAAWIATPVIKRIRGVTIPFLERFAYSARDTLFIYGGRWMCNPESPKGMKENPLYGPSSNQQMLTIGANCSIDVDDYVFLRPTQSESVMLQFGNLLPTRAGRLAGNWPVLRNELPNGPATGDHAVV